MLQIDELRVSYGRIPALHGISLHVDEREAVAIVGPNGAGKTTTLSAIFGLVAPADGSILFDGKSLVGASPEKILRRGLALVPEGRHIFGTLTSCREPSARHDCAEISMRRRETWTTFSTAFRACGRTTEANRGDAFRWRAAACDRPCTALTSAAAPLDEPSLGLAPVVIDVVFDALEELRSEGVTILLVEQNAARAVEFADRAYILRSGRVAHAGTRDEICVWRTSKPCTWASRRGPSSSTSSTPSPTDRSSLSTRSGLPSSSGSWASSTSLTAS